MLLPLSFMTRELMYQFILYKDFYKYNEYSALCQQRKYIYTVQSD